MDVFLILCLEFPTIFHNSNNSPGFLAFLEGFDQIKQKEVLWIILVVRLLLRLLWLISTPTLLIGNRLQKSAYISWWQTFAIILVLYSAVTSAYFLVIHYECSFLGNIATWMKELQSAKPESTAGRDAARFVVFLALFDGAVIFFIPTVIFIVCVHLRGMDIRYRKKETQLLDSWTIGSAMELAPYRIPRAKVTNSMERSQHRSSAPPSTASTAPINSIARSPFFFENDGYEVDHEPHHYQGNRNTTLPTAPLKRAFL